MGFRWSRVQIPPARPAYPLLLELFSVPTAASAYLRRTFSRAGGLSADATCFAVARQTVPRTYTSQYDQNQEKADACRPTCGRLGTSGRKGAVQRTRTEGEDRRAAESHSARP